MAAFNFGPEPEKNKIQEIASKPFIWLNHNAITVVYILNNILWSTFFKYLLFIMSKRYKNLSTFAKNNIKRTNKTKKKNFFIFHLKTMIWESVPCHFIERNILVKVPVLLFGFHNFQFLKDIFARNYKRFYYKCLESE